MPSATRRCTAWSTRCCSSARSSSGSRCSPRRLRDGSARSGGSATCSPGWRRWARSARASAGRGAARCGWAAATRCWRRCSPRCGRGWSRRSGASACGRASAGETRARGRVRGRPPRDRVRAGRLVGPGLAGRARADAVRRELRVVPRDGRAWNEGPRAVAAGRGCASRRLLSLHGPDADRRAGGPAAAQGARLPALRHRRSRGVHRVARRSADPAGRPESRLARRGLPAVQRELRRLPPDRGTGRHGHGRARARAAARDADRDRRGRPDRALPHAEVRRGADRPAEARLARALHPVDAFAARQGRLGDRPHRPDPGGLRGLADRPPRPGRRGARDRREDDAVRRIARALLAARPVRRGAPGEPRPLEPDATERSVGASRRAEAAAIVLMLLAALGGAAFPVLYVAWPENEALGLAIGLALVFAAAAAVVAGKAIVPREQLVEEREEFGDEDERDAALDRLGSGGKGVTRRKALVTATGVAGLGKKTPPGHE